MSLPLRWEDPQPKPTVVISTGEPIRKSRSRVLRRVRAFCGVVGATALASLAVVGGATIVNSLRPAADLRLEPSHASDARAVLTSATTQRRLGFVTVTGSVLSHNPQALPRVEAVVELLDDQNHTVQVESSMVAFDPLPPNEAAPFRVNVTDVPRAVAYRVRFRQLDGLCLN